VKVPGSISTFRITKPTVLKPLSNEEQQERLRGPPSPPIAMDTDMTTTEAPDLTPMEEEFINKDGSTSTPSIPGNSPAPATIPSAPPLAGSARKSSREELLEEELHESKRTTHRMAAMLERLESRLTVAEGALASGRPILEKSPQGSALPVNLESHDHPVHANRSLEQTHLANQDQIPYSRAAEALPKPQILTDQMVASFVANPELANAYLAFAFNWLATRGFQLKHILGYMGATVGLSWAQAIFEENPQISEQDFAVAFLTRFTGQVRSQRTLALEKIVSRSIMQGQDDIGMYASKFTQVARLLPEESQVSLCQHYVAGLNLNMRATCCLDMWGDEWEDLHACIKFSLAAAVRASRANEILHDTRSRFPGAKDYSRPQEEIPFKRQKSRWGGSGPVVAALDPNHEEAGPSRPREYRPHSTIQLIKGDKRSIIPLPPPGPDIPGFLCTEVPISKAHRESLRLYWICTFCRGDCEDGGRHYAEQCPKKNK
jgi:hypothetical protein